MSASANSRLKPLFRNCPSSVCKPHSVVNPLNPPVPPAAERASMISVVQPARAALMAAAMPAAPLPTTAMSNESLMDSARTPKFIHRRKRRERSSKELGLHRLNFFGHGQIFVEVLHPSFSLF